LWTSLGVGPKGFSGENLNQGFPIPLGDPVRADGKLFYLQTTVTSGRAVFSLVCFDPAIAQPVWAAPIIDSKADVGSLQHNYSYLYGNAVTVHRGAVYSCSNVGHITRSDVRDGRVEWAHKYEYRGTDTGAIGSTPIIAGSNVIFLPRNAERIIALDQRTGALAWDNLGIRASEVLGLWQDTLVVRGPKHLAGLDVATGNTRWIRNLTQRALTRGQLIADSVYFGESGALQRFDARTGELLESRPWAIESERALSFTISEQNLYIATDQPREDPRQKVGQPLGPEVASSAQPLKLPLKPAWSLMRPGASLLLPPAGVNPGTAILLGDGMIECLEVNERGGIRWRRFLDLKINQLVIRYIGKKGEILLLLEQGESFDRPPRAVGLDSKTGATLWQTTVPLWRDPPPTLCGSRLIFGSHSRRGGGATAIDLTTGQQLWRRYIRSNAPPVVKGDESHLVLLGNLGTPKPTRVTLNAQTGQTIADSPDKSAWPTVLYTVHSRNGPSVYLLPPVGDPTVFQPQAGIADQIPGTGAPYYLIQPRDGNDKTPMGVYRADDPSYFCKLTNDNVLFEGDYAITMQGKLEITDLKAKRLLPLPATDEKTAINQPGLLCRIGPDRLLKLVDHGSAKNVVFIIDLASGTVTEGKLELPSQDGPINLANYLNSSAQINFTAQNRPFLPTFDRVFLTYDNTTVTAWVAAP
jgi:outer membrane protein assembly factor BamB